MCHLGFNQIITVYHFSLLCEMDESRLRIPKTSDEEKTSIINFVPKSTVYKNKWAIQIFPRMSGHLDIVSKSLKIWIQYPNL